MEIINRIHQLNFDSNKFVIIDSGVMDALGLRTADDIDLVVTEDFFRELADRDDWTIKPARGGYMLAKDDVKVALDWGDLSWDFESLYKNSLYIEGIAFASPEDVLRWKKQQNRPKDTKDIELLENYLSKK